uniref:Uncharacterized protein n=1 Tax=Encephalitozoon cuniculi TaxID=6035 RepID=M1K8H1_ENCCN|nr:hypothetical protein ECU02_1310 [Encephalitozoon cuniculi]
MIFDYGIYFSRKVSVCLHEGCILIGSRTTFTVVKVEIADRCHLFLHPGAKRKRSYIERIASDPRLILRSSGDPKVNLKLYVSFVTGGKYRPSIRGNRRQKMIGNAIEGKKATWKDIAAKDVYGYDKLLSVLGIDMDLGPLAGLKRKIMNMLRHVNDEENTADERETIRRILRNESDPPGELTFALMAHYDFCTKNEVFSFMDELGKEYGKMLDLILYDRLESSVEECRIDHPFYNEVALFNSFVKCKDDILHFDRKALEKDVFHTINERGIRDFITKKVEMFYASGGGLIK